MISKSYIKISFLQVFFWIGSNCYSQSSNYLGPIEIPSEITRNMMSWLYYERDNIVWSADYISLDTALNKISKENFLKRLITGNYLPLKIRAKDSSLCYQLCLINESADKEIGKVISQKAGTEYNYYKMEGQLLPSFNFTDMNGNVYNNSTTKGKIVVLNCWFIHCQPCNEEIPRLNQLVKKFRNQKDILFIGLAFDAEDELKKFLSKTIFKYAIVAYKEDYLENDLKIISYPTHLIINREGKIVKVIDRSIEELTNALNNEINK